MSAETPIPTDDTPVTSRKRYRLLIAVCIVCALVMKAGFLFFFIGMLPAIAAYAGDHDRHKYIFTTIAAFNLAGVFPDMMDIVMQGNTWGAVQAKLTDAMVWLTIYSAAGMGWVLVWLSPMLAGAVLEGIYRGRIAHMESLQKKLTEDWGADVAGK